MGDSAALESLPDYSSLCQLREALWSKGEIRGAAVMVGAGFSRCAKRVSASAPVPPLWSTFEAAMKERLYPGLTESYDPLKLAEEYRVALGHHALDALIRRLVTDERWLPSDFHTRLLALPWADVLTTNWDTLLERTVLPNADSSYDIVRTVQDIARTRSPRIVKLHGSLPSHEPFIFTAEDFRTYPQQFAPLINLAQQVLLENDLCLVGFSGDDPNFLQWSGWVRDQLGHSARRIRLVGALNLSDPQRQVLEQRNVTPIDFGPLVREHRGDEMHAAALDLFLHALRDGKPQPAHKWVRQPRVEKPEGMPSEELIKKCVERWKIDREGYPGWLVAPAEFRGISSIDSTHVSAEIRTAIADINPDLRAQALSEIAWRFEVTFHPLDDFLIAQFASCLRGSEQATLSKAEKMGIASLLAREFRYRFNWDSFREWTTYLGELDDPEASARCQYEKALKAASQFDFPEITRIVSSVSGDDPVWHLRRAFLYCIINEFDKALEIIGEARRQIHALRSRDKNSIWLLSREAWATWLAYYGSRDRFSFQDKDADDLWSNRYHAAKCDPWSHLQFVDAAIVREADERANEAVTIEPSFDAGTYQDHSQRVRFGGWGPTAIGDILRLRECVGLPDRIGLMALMGDRVPRAFQAMPDITEPSLLLAASNIRHHEKGLIKQYFGRVAVASLPPRVVTDLFATLRPAIDFALREMARGKSEWAETTKVFFELLSRLMIRQPPHVAKDTFLWAVRTARDAELTSWWLSEALANLIYRSLEAVPPEERRALAFEMLRFPLPTERKLGGIERDWPELADRFDVDAFKDRDANPEWAFRIAQLIQYVRSGDRLNRTRAILRLHILVGATALLPDESRDLAAAIWGRRVDNIGLPADSDVYAHVFLSMPAPEKDLAGSIFRRVIVEPLLEGQITSFRLKSLQGSATTKLDAPLRIEVEEAIKIFAVCIAWRYPAVDRNRLAEFGRDEREIERSIGGCLAWAVLPHLTVGALTNEHFESWRDAIETANIPSLLLTLPHMLTLFPEHKNRAISLFRRALAARDEITVNAALNAVIRLSRLHRKDGVEIPPIIASDVAAMCAIRRESGLLHSIAAARHLLSVGVLERSDQTRLIDTLDLLLVDLDYNDWKPSDPRTKTLSLIRAECVRLADALRHAGQADAAIDKWLACRKTDAFPEVRFTQIVLEDES
jgi:hypothetical protein